MMRVSVAATATPTTTNTTTTPAGPTAAGWIALLQEDDLQLRAAALEHLLEHVDTIWHQIAEALPDLEAMAEEGELAAFDTTTTRRKIQQTAAAVASRVFFHLEEPQQALRLALMAGPSLVPLDNHAATVVATSSATTTSSSPYVDQLVAAALDAYVAARRRQEEEEEEEGRKQQQREEEEEEDIGISLEQLQGMINRLLMSTCQAGHYEQALGIALEAQEASKVREILQAASTTTTTTTQPAAIVLLLKYALNAALNLVSSKTFRLQVLQVIADCLQTQFVVAKRKAAAYDLVVVYQLLSQSKETAIVLQQLLTSSSSGGSSKDDDNDDDALLGLQLCFDLQDSGDQAFVQAVAEHLSTAAAAGGGGGGGTASEQQQQQQQQQHPRIEQALRVLTGGFPNELALSFLHKHSKADRLQMDQLKKALEERSSGSRSSILHNAAVMTHAYLHQGTTNDSFLRDHLDWMKKASNWGKFSATASLGIVHAGHITEAMHLLEPYLPSDPTEPGNEVSSTGGFAEGGSLYALGLIHGSQAGSASADRELTNQFLRRHLRASHANEVISHGAALGVGLTAMGSASLEIVRELKEVLDTDSAVAGEAAGMAIGMVLVGTGAGNTHNSLKAEQQQDFMEVVAELKNYARETQHEKIIRGIAMGLALMNFGQEENADALIEEMRSDRDPIMRYGAMYALSLAYCGTGSNKAIRILLHTAVSDVSDDVRMAAVIGLAFVLFKTPERVPQLVNLLLESFNPHVRYASCMAVGIAMAGTGDAESISLLEPMLEDMTDYVRQGALMGTAMIYMQQSDTCNGRRIRSFRDRLATIVTEKHQSTLTKMGAILSTGIMEAGGRNCALELGSRFGFTKMSSAVGLALWLQHWHWFPMMHMFSLALTPTFTIGLNKDFKFPKKFEIQCNSKPSAFAYPKKLEEKKEEKKKRVETVTLSTTAKEKARLARKRAKLGLDLAMDVDKEDSKDEQAEKKKEDAMDVDMEDTSNEEGGGGGEDEANKPTEKKPPKKREPEPTSFRVSNPSRITKAQSLVCTFDLNQRYRPIRPDENPVGVIMLTDSTPEVEEDDLGVVKSPSDEPEGELAPPEPFVWTPPPVAAPSAPAVVVAAATTSETSEKTE